MNFSRGCENVKTVFGVRPQGLALFFYLTKQVLISSIKRSQKNKSRSGRRGPNGIVVQKEEFYCAGSTSATWLVT